MSTASVNFHAQWQHDDARPEEHEDHEDAVDGDHGRLAPSVVGGEEKVDGDKGRRNLAKEAEHAKVKVLRAMLKVSHVSEQLSE